MNKQLCVIRESQNITEEPIQLCVIRESRNIDRRADTTMCDMRKLKHRQKSRYNYV